ncbi:MAG TPA: glutathione transferase [Kofleriaceae bacterium]|jgi:glutathione S-transferase
MADLTLYVDPSWMDPACFHAMIALEEKQLPYKLAVVPTNAQAVLENKGVIGAMPMLVHDTFAFTDPVAISEYLAERFPIPDHPRIFAADLKERARQRELMTWLRTGLVALHADRPTKNVFGRPTLRPLTSAGGADADELLRVATAIVKPGAPHMFGNWTMADADLALALMRLIGSQDHVPEHLIAYALAQWDRRSIKRFVAHVPTTP